MKKIVQRKTLKFALFAEDLRLKMIVFWDVALCTLRNVHRRSSEVLKNVYQIRWRYIPDYAIFHSHSREREPRHFKKRQEDG
jgi:hypothetical protein